jgi:hypothetical protein
LTAKRWSLGVLAVFDAGPAAQDGAAGTRTTPGKANTAPKHRDRVQLYEQRRRVRQPDPRQTMTLPERVRTRVRVDANDCWLWQGAHASDGYGLISNRPGQRPLNLGVHRVMYEDAHGPIPDGTVVAHLSGVKLRCNPAHLALAGPTGRAPAVIAPTRRRSGKTIRDAPVPRRSVEPPAS